MKIWNLGDTCNFQNWISIDNVGRFQNFVIWSRNKSQNVRSALKHACVNSFTTSRIGWVKCHNIIVNNDQTFIRIYRIVQISESCMHSKNQNYNVQLSIGDATHIPKWFSNGINIYSYSVSFLTGLPHFLHCNLQSKRVKLVSYYTDVEKNQPLLLLMAMPNSFSLLLFSKFRRQLFSLLWVYTAEIFTTGAHDPCKYMKKVQSSSIKQML